VRHGLTQHITAKTISDTLWCTVAKKNSFEALYC